MSQPDARTRVAPLGDPAGSQSRSNFDAMVVGGGPAGSTCARALVRAGMRVAVFDRDRFPRVKLCGGWLSPPVWDTLELSPKEYPGAVWHWTRCHVHHRGRLRTVSASGYFIRRYEFDDFLLRRSGAEIVEHSVRRVERHDGLWVLDGVYRAPLLIGAGGTHCPVSRQLFRAKCGPPVAAQEHEFEIAGGTADATRVGRDGEPELLLHDDLGGYSWSVPKGPWLNLGSGTSEPREVLAAWAAARAFFTSAGHVPERSLPLLEHAKGHSYYLFDAAHLASCEQDGAVLVGDALGLAHPLTAEGILPALLSGRLAGEALAAGTPKAYRASIERHPLFLDYTLARELLRTALALRAWLHAKPVPLPRLGGLALLSGEATARGFAWLFGGQPIPCAGLLRALLPSTRSATHAAG